MSEDILEWLWFFSVFALTFTLLMAKEQVWAIAREIVELALKGEGEDER